jgi:hypothetical protein
MPRAMLFRDFINTKKQYTREWEDFASLWFQPAKIKANMKRAIKI